ncbi:MAG TPA: AGE family epimerase/isomerase [Rectinemataceae bacterium]|nr:AGE family epimerase/isomerase [Rectinemataceae bacterium]
MSASVPSAAALCAEWRARLPSSDCGYAEALDEDWREVGGRERNFLVQARLAYSFIHAGLLGDERCAEEGLRASERNERLFWDEDSGGWIRSIAASGKPIDSGIDTYDQAFGLLCLAWRYRASGEAGCLRRAHKVIEALGEASRDPARFGYPERRGRSAAVATPAAAAAATPAAAERPGWAFLRRQNPHMHLLEAFLAWHEAEPSGFWLERAAEMIALFRTRFREPQRGSLREFFEEDLSPAGGEAGRHREPGHHFEWVWLLRRYALAGGDGACFAQARELYTFGCGHGLDSDGLAFDAIRDDGAVLAGSKLLWPQTELVKAHLAWFEWTGEGGALDAAHATLASLGEHYFLADSSLWRSQLDRELRPTEQPILSRLLYHVLIALLESERHPVPSQAQLRGVV